MDEKAQSGNIAAPPPEYDQAVSSQPRYTHPNPVMQQPCPQHQQQQQQQPMGQQLQYVGGQQQTVTLQGGQQPIVIINTGPVRLSENPMPMTCIYCHERMITRVEYMAGINAWTWAFVCCILGCFLGCCLIPLYYRGCQDVKHFCPKCHKRIGIWRRNESVNQGGGAC